MVNETPPAGLLKGDMFLLVLDETWFLKRTLGSIQRNSGQVSSMRGIPKGALPPLCRRGGGVHRGGTPSKGSRPYACFCLLFPRGKSRSGSGGETPGSRQIEWQQFGKRNVSLSPTPRYANQPCIGQMRWHRGIKAEVCRASCSTISHFPNPQLG